MKLKTRIINISILLLFIVTTISLNYLKENKLQKLNEFAVSQYKTSNVKILLWTKIYKSKAKSLFGSLGQEPFLHHNCSVNKCEILDEDESFKEADVVMFHFGDLARDDRKLQKLPAFRRPDQNYAAYFIESAANFPFGFASEKFNGFFNSTIGYWKDADVRDWAIIFQYSNDMPKFQMNEVYKMEKDKNISWIVSNCHSKSRRKQYFDELSKYIKTEQYGHCNNKPCRKESCYNTIVSKSIFYFSAENSLCRDYLTEKAFNPLLFNTIPVVLGGANYTEYMPPGSYIDIRDFKSAKVLANHLTKVMKNRTLYESYFNWKSNWRYVNRQGLDGAYLACKICAYYTKMRNHHQVYNDFTNQWISGNRCQTTQDYYRGHF